MGYKLWFPPMVEGLLAVELPLFAAPTDQAVGDCLDYRHCPVLEAGPNMGQTKPSGLTGADSPLADLFHAPSVAQDVGLATDPYIAPSADLAADLAADPWAAGALVGLVAAPLLGLAPKTGLVAARSAVQHGQDGRALVVFQVAVDSMDSIVLGATFLVPVHWA